MATINFALREIESRVVYWGPKGAGKSSNLVQLHERLPSELRNPLHRRLLPGTPSAHVELLSVRRGDIAGYSTTFRLISVPSWSAALRVHDLLAPTVDAVVFVADCTPGRHGANQGALEGLKRMLEARRIEPSDLPLVVQLNHRDALGARPTGDVARVVGLSAATSVEAVASRGEGVLETLEAISNATSGWIRDLLAGRRNAMTLEALDQRQTSTDEELLDELVGPPTGDEDLERLLTVNPAPVEDSGPPELDSFYASVVERTDPTAHAPQPAEIESPEETSTYDHTSLPPGPAVRQPFLPRALGGYRAVRIISARVSPAGGVELELLAESTQGRRPSRCTVHLDPDIVRPPTTPSLPSVAGAVPAAEEDRPPPPVPVAPVVAALILGSSLGWLLHRIFS